MNIANQSFPSFRTDLNNALTALNTMHSGTSRPSGAAVGTLWLDTTNSGSNSLEMKFFDGSDDISFATINTSANTINFIDSTISITGLSSSASATILTLQDTNVQVSGGATQGGEVRFLEDTDTGSHYVALKAGNPASNLTLVLPTADATSSGQALVSDGSGNLSFADAGISTGKAIAMAIVFG